LSTERTANAVYVAPMMAWTDRHCRYLLRLAAAQTTLFTEMISAPALLDGPAERLLAHHPAEHPLVIQLGGSDPDELAAAAAIAAERGYAEINLNVGCPSPRVQRGRFGACLMREPDLVARIVRAMAARVDVPVSVKCRLGVDDHDSQALLEDFVRAVADVGCERFYVHARKAFLKGLSPAENRDVPPLEYERVYQLKARFPALSVIVNGGIDSVDAALDQLAHLDGVMIGRAAYKDPLFVNALAGALHGEPATTAAAVMDRYLAYMADELGRGTRLKDMTRHCLGLFAGRPGARTYRRLLSDQRRLETNDLGLVHEALQCVQPLAA
jgi:tRNA-dihydrouridine synthase A